MLWAAAMTSDPGGEQASPKAQVATSPTLLTTQPTSRPPMMAPTPCTDTITDTNVAGRSKASSRA